MNKRTPLDPFIAVDFKGRKEASETRQLIRSRAAHHSHKVGRKSRKKRSNPPTQESSPTQARFEPLQAQQDVILGSGGASVTGLLQPVSDGIVFPVPEHDFYRSTIQYMWVWMINAWECLETTETERRNALVWVQRLTMSNAAYFYMNMLSCCSVLVDHGSLPTDVIPWLMAQTVRAINDALCDPQNMLNIGVILAVGRIALRECMRGNYEVGTKIHRPAQAKMIAMAGGLNKLDVPVLVRKHLLWAERLVTKRTGVSLAMLHPEAVEQEIRPQSPNADDLTLKRYWLNG